MQIKEHLASCNRSIKWKVDVSAELDALADTEADLRARRSSASRELNALQAEREEMLATMQASHDADRTPLTADDVSRMLGEIDEIDERIQVRWPDAPQGSRLTTPSTPRPASLSRQAAATYHLSPAT